MTQYESLVLKRHVQGEVDRLGEKRLKLKSEGRSGLDTDESIVYDWYISRLHELNREIEASK